MASRTTSVRIEERYYTGMDMSAETRRDLGYKNSSRTDIIRIALDKYFEEIGISDHDIAERMRESTQPNLV